MPRNTYEKGYDSLHQEMVDRCLTTSTVSDNWGTKGPWKFNDKRKAKFLEHYAGTGQLASSAAKVGVSRSWIFVCRKKDPAFALAVEEAKLLYCDVLEEEMHRRAVCGVDKPIIGGRNRDTIVTTVKEYSDSLLSLRVKRYMPEYRDKYEGGEEGIGGGVLVVQTPCDTAEDWTETFSGAVDA